MALGKRQIRVVALGLVVLAGASVAVAYRLQERARLAREETVRALFEPALRTLAAGSTPGLRADLDTTAVWIRAFDRAAEASESLPAFLGIVGAKAVADVAPEVVATRAALLRALARVVAQIEDAREAPATWSFAREVLLAVPGTLRQATAEDGATRVSVDATRGRRLLTEARARTESAPGLAREAALVEAGLLRAVLDAAEVTATRLGEWERLCDARDHAAVAAEAGEWNTVVEYADAAIELAPHERAAHLLKALAWIEAAPHGPVEDANPARDLLDSYLSVHPQARAPALVLKGALAGREGRQAAAHRALNEAGEAYAGGEIDPALTAILRARAEAPEATLLMRRAIEPLVAQATGGGYFAPELQRARVLAEGRSPARQVLLSQLERRVEAKAWDQLVRDATVAESLAGEDFAELLREAAYFDLSVRQIDAGRVALAVRNRSDVRLADAAAVLSVRFTGEPPEASVVFPIGRATLEAHGITELGEIELAARANAGGVAQIASHRLFVVAENFAGWIDSEAYRLGTIDEARARRARGERGADGDVPPAVIADLVKDGANLAVTPQFMADDVTIALPRALAALGPEFSLRFEGRELHAVEHELHDEEIHLRFAGVQNFQQATRPYADLELRLASRWVALRAVWRSDNQGAWRLDVVEPLAN